MYVKGCMVRIKEEEFLPPPPPPEFTPATPTVLANIKKIQPEEYVADIGGEKKMLDIVRRLSAETGISVREIRGHSRRKHLVEVRHIAMYLCYKLGPSLTVIGRFFNGRDHTTVLHAIQKMERRYAQ